MRIRSAHCHRFSLAIVQVLCTCLLLVPFDAHAKLYRCQDDRGQWAFQDRPCPHGTERESVRQRNLAPTPAQVARQRLLPKQCKVDSEPFRFEHEDLLGVEAILEMHRDEDTYQLGLRARGEWIDPEFEARPLVLKPALADQGLIVGDGGLANPDWLADLRFLGFGHSRTRGLLESAKTALDLHVVIHIRGRAEADWSLPIPAAMLDELRQRAFECKDNVAVPEARP